MPNLSLDNIINVVVTTAKVVETRVGLNVGLIIGSSVDSSSSEPYISVSERCKAFSNLDAVAAQGYPSDSPEYLAAALYFGQKAVPESLVIGYKASSESWADAVADCRAKNASWYGVYAAVANLSTEDHAAIAGAVASYKACYFFDDSADADLTSVSTDVFSSMRDDGYERVVGMYSKSAYAGAALMGYAMGANNGAADSAYTLAYKSLNGVTVDDLTAAQVQILEDKNANCYVKRGTRYEVFEKGVCANGKFFDELIGVDQLAYDLQNACMDVLVNANGKVPYTDAGALQFVLACNEVCSEAVRTGFIAPGIWQGNNIISLSNGDTLESGFLCQVEPVAKQTFEQRTTRKAPPVYVCAILAGAIHSVIIRVDVE